MKKEEALDEQVESAPATVETMKNKAALDLIRAGKDASATAEIPGMKEESAEEAATTEIIRTKKKEVMDLLRARDRMRAKDRMREREANPAGAEEEGKNGTEEKKKRKRVVRRMFPQAAIDFLIAKASRPIDTIPDDLLATYSHRVRDLHLIRLAIEKKLREYDQAVIDQYLTLGYAVDENEVTDDELEN